MICTLLFKPPSHKDPDMFNRAIANIESGVLDIRSWMVINFLKLNDLKTELLLIGSRYGSLVPCSHIQIGNEHVPPSVSARNLGVNFDSGMTLEAHANSIVSAAFYHLKNICSIPNHLTHEALVTQVHAHVISRLDYCNALLYGLSAKILYKVQTAQNAAARVGTGTNKIEHITRVLNNLYWLPVKFRIKFQNSSTNFQGISWACPFISV